MKMTMEKRGWYLDKLGVERPCIVINSSLMGLVAVMGMDGKVLEGVKPEDVYYVPQHAEGEAEA